MDILKINIDDLEQDRNILEALAFMKQEYDNEFFRKIGKKTNRTRAQATEIIQQELDEYDFFIGKNTGEIVEYVGYTSGLILRERWYKSMATFVKPGFRRKGIGEQLKTVQIEHAKSLSGCIGFTTVVNEVNEGAIKMMKKIGAHITKSEGELRNVNIKF